MPGHVTIIRYGIAHIQINIGGGHQLDAQPSDTPSDSAPAEAAAAANDQEADNQSSYSSDAQGEDAAVPAAPLASNKKRKLLHVAALAPIGQDPDGDSDDHGANDDDGVSLLRKGKCCRHDLGTKMGRLLWTPLLP